MYKTNNNEGISIIISERQNLDWLWLGIVFLFSLNFLNKPNHLILGVLLIGAIVASYKKNSIRMTSDLLFIWFFSLSYFIIVSYHTEVSIGTIFTYMIGPVSFFLIGNIIVKFENNIIFKTILTMVFANFLHGFLNMVLYFRAYGYTPNVIGSRVFPDVWKGSGLSGTIQGTNFTLIASLLFYAIVLFLNKQRKGIALIILVSIIFSLFATFIMGNRTLIVIIAITFIASLLLYGILKWKDPKKIIRSLMLVLFSASIVYALYLRNSFGTKDFVENSTWYMRSNVMITAEDPRILVYKRAAAQMFDFPFGGYNMNLGLLYAHNLWIDVLYSTGLIPFIFLSLYTLQSIKNLIRLLKQKTTDIGFKILIFSIYLGFLSNFMVEPILEGVPYMFLSFCLINGMIRKQVDRYNEMSLLKEM